MNWLGITYLVLGFFSLASSLVNVAQGIVIRSDRSLFAIAGGCLGFGLFNLGVAFTSGFTGSAYSQDPAWYACAGAGMVLLTVFVPMIPWTLLDMRPTLSRVVMMVVLVGFSVVRAFEMVWRAVNQPGTSWERLHLSSVSSLAIASGLLPMVGAGFWVTAGVPAWRQHRRLGASITIFGALAIVGAAKGLFMSLGWADPPDTFGFMALPAIAFVNVAASIRFIDAVRTANNPAGDMQRYQIIRPIGSGGMGDVFLARRRGAAGFLRDVVLKTMRQSTGDPEAHERFLAEARVAAQLRHPNIIDVYDLGEQPDGFFIVMERIDGVTLGEIIKRSDARGVSVAPDIVAELGAQLCRALGYAHAAHIIHRDLKPQNVMVTVAGVAKLIDFGIAQEQGVPLKESPRGAPPTAGASGSLTRDDGIVGTLGYMPPERLRGGVATAATDLFALGVVLYELLTLRSPFPQAEGAGFLEAVEAGRFERLAQLRPDCPPALSQAIEQCLSASPGARPASAPALEAELSLGLGDKRIDLAAWLRALQLDIAAAQTQPRARTTPMDRSDAPTTPARVKG